MAGSAMSEMILFVGATLAALVVAAALGGVATQYSAGLHSRSTSLAAELDSGIAVVNDPAAVPNGPLVLYVKNTGARELDPALFTILVDGQARTPFTVTVAGAPATVVRPAELATVTITGLTVAAGDHTVHIVAGSGARADFLFTV